MTFTEITNDIPLFLAYLICIACLVQLFIIFFVHRKTIMVDLRGKDLHWQFIELSGIVWLVLFPVVVVSSMFGLQIQTGVWASMDAVYFMNLGGKIGHKWLDSKNKEKEKPNEQV